MKVLENNQLLMIIGGNGNFADEDNPEVRNQPMSDTSAYIGATIGGLIVFLLLAMCCCSNNN